MCVQGRYQSDASSTACLNCIPGQYQSQEGKKSCIKCEKGSFSGTPAQPTCQPCLIGQYTPTDNSAACQSCDAGKFGVGCKACPSGRYRSADDSDLTQCKQCETGKTTGDQKAPTACINCELGKYGNSNRICAPCPDNQYRAESHKTTCDTCGIGEIPNDSKTACLKPTYKTVTSCDYSTQYLNDTGKKSYTPLVR